MSLFAPRFIPHLVIVLKGEYEGGEPIATSPDECDRWEAGIILEKK